jgi:hypothetical protein
MATIPSHNPPGNGHLRLAADLQAARRAAAEKFEAIALAHVPRGWRVQYRKCRGYCYPESKLIVAPRPCTRKSLYRFLHECGHAHQHGVFGRKPRHVEEMEAEKWARAAMHAAGVPIPRSMIQRGNQYVAQKIKQALSGGAKHIHPEARRLAGRFITSSNHTAGARS